MAIPITDPVTTSIDGIRGIKPFLLYMSTPGRLWGRSCITRDTPTADRIESPEYMSNGIVIIPAPTPTMPMETPARVPMRI